VHCLDRNSHVLVILHGSVQVELFNVDRHEVCVGSGHTLSRRHFAVMMSAVGVRANVSWVLNEVGANVESDAVGFCFFVSYIGNDAQIDGAATC
jgi:hypothetical protein